eukprot:scaffold23396_cov29-Tisochrysis_lutea.AAC.1
MEMRATAKNRWDRLWRSDERLSPFLVHPLHYLFLGLSGGGKHLRRCFAIVECSELRILRYLDVFYIVDTPRPRGNCEMQQLARCLAAEEI